MGMPGSAAGNEFVDYYSLSLLNEICGVSSKRGGSGSMRLFAISVPSFGPFLSIPSSEDGQVI